MNQKKIINLRDIAILFLILVLLISIAYKYLEWNIFDQLAKLQNSSIPAELSIIEKSDSITESFILNVEKLTASDSKPEKIILIYDELDGIINLDLDNNKLYKETIETNSNKYKTLNLLSKILIGKKGEIAKRIISDQIQYYKNEQKNAYDNIVSTYLLKNIFMVNKDKVIMQVYDEKASKSPETLYSKYFSDIAPLEKYTRNDFKFLEEDAIRKLYSYGYETLQNNKNYMKTYYSMVKDFITNDYESAKYKYTKLQDAYIKLNVDMDRIFNENKSLKQDRLKEIIKLVVDKSAAIKDIKINNFNRYPFLPTIKGWKEDLEICQIYAVKGSLISDLLNKPIEAKDINGYLDWLAKMNPSTLPVDNLFDKSIINFTNDDKKIIFNCLDKESNKKYTFLIFK